MKNTKRQTEAQTANESRKKRKMSQNAKKASGFDIVGKEAITQLNNLMIPKYWLVNYDGTNFVMNVKHNGQIFQVLSLDWFEWDCLRLENVNVVTQQTQSSHINAYI